MSMEWSSLEALLRWWLLTWALGLLLWPLWRTWAGALTDQGYVLSRALSPLMLAYGSWLLSSLGWVPFSADSARALTLVAVVAALRIRWRQQATQPPSWRAMAASECLFAVAFLVMVAQRGWLPDIAGLEKPMNFAFINAASLSAWMPPHDPWLAGHTINYYYFSHFNAAFLCLLTGVDTAAGYNLMLAQVFGLTAMLSHALMREWLHDGRSNARGRGAIALLAAALITVGGNYHGFIYGLVQPLAAELGVMHPGKEFYFPDSTRFVGYNPPTDDRLITEFPAYSSIVGDLHAHYANLPQVLAFLLVLLVVARGDHRWTRDLPLTALLLGSFAMSNSWDAALYGLLAGGVLLARGWRRHGLVAGTATGVLQGVSLLGGALLVSLPFLLHFHVFGHGVGLTHSRTPLWQWLILYGYTLPLVLAPWILRRHAPPEPSRQWANDLAGVLAMAGIAFAVLPELVFLRDIYGADHYRANTAFKLGYQAFVLLTLCASFGAERLLVAGRHLHRPLATLVLIELLLAPPLLYAWLGPRLPPWSMMSERPLSLDGNRFLRERYPGDASVIAWLRANAPPEAVVLEAVGESYTDAARIATASGRPTLLGWPVHEWLWRGSRDIVDEREAQVAAVYRACDGPSARDALQALQPRPQFMVIGELERRMYPDLCESVLRELGAVRHRAPGTWLIELERAP